jgi:Rrf2 family iron-sulfur cluster assembly transcriptional regulator
MDVIKRNTDYALRAVVELAGRSGHEPVATREIASRQRIPYQLACKLLQRLHKAGIVKSSMGPAGGFMLSGNPSKITVRQVVEVIQGPVQLNRCLFRKSLCRLSRRCTISPELGRLQKKINAFLDGLTLDRLSNAGRDKRRKG